MHPCIFTKDPHYACEWKKMLVTLIFIPSSLCQPNPTIHILLPIRQQTQHDFSLTENSSRGIFLLVVFFLPFFLSVTHSSSAFSVYVRSGYYRRQRDNSKPILCDFVAVIRFFFTLFGWLLQRENVLDKSFVGRRKTRYFCNHVRNYYVKFLMKENKLKNICISIKVYYIFFYLNKIIEWDINWYKNFPEYFECNLKCYCFKIYSTKLEFWVYFKDPIWVSCGFYILWHIHI